MSTVPAEPPRFPLGHAAAVLRLGVRDRQHRDLEKRIQKLRGDRDGIRRSLQSPLEHRWPELTNLFNPRAAKTVADEAVKIGTRRCGDE